MLHKDDMLYFDPTKRPAPPGGRVDYSNQNHPEILEGEKFLTNTSHDMGNCWDELICETKRRGAVAYDIWGRPVQGMYPIFVSIAEIRAKNEPNRTLDT